MPIISNNFIYEATSETVTKPVVAHRANVEFTTDCRFNCRGCFVNKKNPPYVKTDLILLEDLIKQVDQTGMIFDELVFGPVDFFGAPNSRDLLREERLQHIMMTYKPIFAIPTTLQCSKEEITDFVVLFNKLYPHTFLEFELQVVVNPKRLQADDRPYIEDLKEKIRMFDDLVSHVCYTLQINIQSLANIDLHKLSLMARDEFQTIIDYNPSFFRSHNPKAIAKMLKLWNDELTRQVNPENKNDIQMVIADWTHGGFNYTNWIISRGKLFLSPFIHENVADTTDRFLVPKSGEHYSVDDLNKAIDMSRKIQYEYAPQTTECSSCPYLSTCVARHILYYMHQYGIKDCVLPKKVLDLYPIDMGYLAHTAYDWSDYTVEGEVEFGNKKHHEFAKEKGIL